jgi:hypothetical protein
MRIDAKALEVLELKRRRIGSLGLSMESVDEVPGFLRWVMSVPIMNAYVKQIVRMHYAEDAETVRAVDVAIGELPRLANQLRAAAPTAAVDDGWPPPLQWKRFDGALESACAEGASAEDRREASETMAFVLEKRALNAWKTAYEGGSQEAISAMVDRVLLGARRHSHRLEDRARIRGKSARTALEILVDVCRALHPPLDDVPHWSDFLPRKPFKPEIDRRDIEEDLRQGRQQKVAEPIQRALDRFVEELHVLGASTLSHRTVVERFKERCVHYDKWRLREIAEQGRGTREDRLTLELARYLHDNGIFVLVRPRVGNLDPDVVGLGDFAVEAKAYADARGARHDIVHAYYQLHAYMTALETGAMRVNEGFVVAFRLDGPTYEPPATYDTGRFLIHSVTIDLGESDVSGRNQPEPIPIREDEIFTALQREPDHAVEYIARARIGFPQGTARMPRGSSRIWRRK